MFVAHATIYESYLNYNEKQEVKIMSGPKSKMDIQDSELFKLFLKHGEIKKFKQGQLIHLQEDSPTQFYMVKSGHLRSFWVSDDGNEITLEVLTPGNMFGTYSALTGTTRLSSVTSITNSEIISMDYETLATCFGKYSTLVAELIEVMGHTIYSLVVQIQSLILLKAQYRIAHALVELGENFKKRPGDTSFEITYTHQDLADIVGLNRVSTTRELNRFKDMGIVELGYKKIIVKDEQRLKEFYNPNNILTR